jgi:DNA-binding CsgD family transcriptional regulator/pimeloyl-ACP methyl ester carboxylesterase
MGGLLTIQYFETSDGTRIAYHVSGHGPPLVLLFPYHINHLALNWEVPLHRNGIGVLARRFTVINVDLRGAGTSEHDCDKLDLERMALDVIELLDTLRIDKVAIWAMGDATFIAAQVAAMEPGRVTSLAFVEAGDSEENRRVFALRKLNRELGADVRAGLVAGIADPQNSAALAKLMKSAVDAERFDSYQDMLSETDLPRILAGLEMPALFVHAAEDQLIGPEAASRLAGAMSDATVLLMPGTSGVDSWRSVDVLEKIARFLEGDRQGFERSDVSGTARAPSIRLTDREEAVLRLIAQGKTNRQISADLYISLNTVSHHLRNVFAKTGASNRTEAAAYALRNGLS